MSSADAAPAAAAAPPRRLARQPGVHSKEIQSVSLLIPRHPYARLDVTPFLALYFALTAHMLLAALRADWHTYTYGRYGCYAAVAAHALVFLFSHWSIGVKVALRYRTTLDLAAAAGAKVVPAKFAGAPEIVPLTKRVVSALGGSGTQTDVGFEFRKALYVFNAESNTFEKLKYPVKETFEYYGRASGFGSEARVLAAAERWGLNKFEVPLPPFAKLLKEQMLAPFFVFQVFCVGLWCLDEYWYYSLFTLFMLVTMECTLVGQRLRNLRELRALQTPKQALYVYRCGKWELHPGEALLPGDVISIGRPSGGAAAEEKVVPADCLLLAGSCIVEEAVLTGESAPMWKVPIAGLDPAERLHIKTDKQYMLFGGTKILQHTSDKGGKLRTPDGGCLAVVLRTGFETAQGRLMRTILFSTERVTANNMETGLFIAFLLIFALAAAYHVLTHGLADPERNRFKLMLNCIMIITSVIPPELPMELSIAVNTSLIALARKRVFCTEPFRIPFAGRVEVCCFDKTGTLTSDHLLLEGLAGVPGAVAPAEDAGGGGGGAAAVKAGSAAAAGADGAAGAASESGSAAGGAVAAAGIGAGLLRDLSALPGETALVLSCCHSLVQVDGEVVGDPLDKAALAAVGWTYAADVALSPDRRTKATILQRFHFNSNLKRMSALLRLEAPATDEATYVAVLKGAPEVVKGLLETVPADYDATYKSYAAQGGRVIALAQRTLPADTDAAAARALTREQAESRAQFAGFAVFQCPLKAESEPALRALTESSHQLMMITGDAPLTACFAASKVHIVTREVLILTHRSDGGEGATTKVDNAAHDDSEYVWVSPDEALRIPFSRARPDLLLLASQHDICLNGDSLAYIESIGLAPFVIPLVQVFARVSPDQKELVLVTLKAAGRTTLMCGDGTNDVGGLKAAHIGVALLASSQVAENMRKAKEAAKEAAKKKDKGGASGSAAAPGKEVATAGAKPSAKASKSGDKKSGSAMLEEMARQGRAATPQMIRMAEMLDKMEASMGDMGEVPLLRPGDASMASPFTAKADGVMPVTDVIKQGRCTLVTTVQMFKILGLLCLSTAYSLSVMYLQGVKLSDIQATLSGLLTAVLFFCISNSKPLDKLSPVRPHPSIFSVYFFGSLLGQMALHMGFLIYMYQQAVAQMPKTEHQAPDADFAPNLVNSVCYIVQAVIQVCTFAVNYVGHPFNTSIRENRGLYSGLYYMTIFLTVVTFEVVPGLNESFGLVPIPSRMRYELAALAVIVYNVSWLLETGLRKRFPAPVPPRKGYEAHAAELRKLQKGQATSKKTQ